MATVDIVLPVKNGERYLAAALDSVATQSFGDWRLLILDHGSSDGTVDVAEKYCARDTRFCLHSFPDAACLSDLLNCGLALCDARYMMRLDADDICYPQRIQVTLDAFKSHQGCIAIGARANRIDEDGRHTGEIKVPTGRIRVAVASFFHNPFVHSAMVMDFSEMMKRGVKYGTDFLGILPVEHRLVVRELAEDYFIFGQLAILGKCVNLPDKLLGYRWHTTNASIVRFKEQMDLSLKISRYLALNFCRMHDLSTFDPAPFCNQAQMLFCIAGQSNFEEEFRRMAAILSRGFGASDELTRELSYRWVLSDRSAMRMLRRYCLFRMHNVPDADEWGALRSWLLRGFPGKNKPRRSMDALPDSWPVNSDMVFPVIES